MALGLFAVVLDYSNLAPDEFHDWYDLEHNPQRLVVPGFLNATRWLSLTRPATAIALYDLADIAVMRSTAFAAIGGANGTPWTKRVMARAGRLLRYEGTLLFSGGDVGSGDAAALRLALTSIDSRNEEEYNNWFSRKHRPAVLKVAGVRAVRYFIGKDHMQRRRLLTLYHFDSAGILESNDWKENADAESARWQCATGGDDLIIDATHYVRRVAAA